MSWPQLHRAGRPGQSAEGVQEQRLPDGSAKIDLEGRFRQQGRVPPAANTPPAPPRGGRVAIIDPQTGQLLTAEAAALLRRLEPRAAPLQAFEVQLRERLGASQDVGGLEEQRLQAGAVKIDLEGRFRSPLVARIGPDSHVAVRHEAAAAAE